MTQKYLVNYCHRFGGTDCLFFRVNDLLRGVTSQHNVIIRVSTVGIIRMWKMKDGNVLTYVIPEGTEMWDDSEVYGSTSFITSEHQNGVCSNVSLNCKHVLDFSISRRQLWRFLSCYWFKTFTHVLPIWNIPWLFFHCQGSCRRCWCVGTRSHRGPSSSLSLVPFAVECGAEHKTSRACFQNSTLQSIWLKIIFIAYKKL